MPFLLVSSASIIEFAQMHAFFKTDYSLVKILFMAMSLVAIYSPPRRLLILKGAYLLWRVLFFCTFYLPGLLCCGTYISNQLDLYVLNVFNFAFLWLSYYQM